ncbi:MAG: hypothetical protein V4467_02190 [Patescibacteria group bacterium]
MSEKFPEPNQKQSDSLRDTLKKGVALGAVAVAVLSAEGCSPDDKNDASKTSDNPSHTRVETRNAGGRLAEQHKQLSERNAHINKMILDNEQAVAKGAELSSNVFLQGYYQLLNKGYVDAADAALFQEGMKMRVLELAQKKGISVDVSKNFKIEIVGGLVPTAATVNGTSIPIVDSDYTPRERELLDMQSGLRHQPATKEANSESKPVRSSPDFDGKNVDF